MNRSKAELLVVKGSRGGDYKSLRGRKGRGQNDPICSHIVEFAEGEKVVLVAQEYIDWLEATVDGRA